MATKRIHTCDTCGKGSDTLFAKRYFGRDVCIPCQKLIVAHVVRGVMPVLRFRCPACNGAGEVTTKEDQGDHLMRSRVKCERCDLARQ